MQTALISCPTCGAEFPAGARFCPKCGYTVPATMPGADPAVVIVEQPVATTTPPTVVYNEAPKPNWTPWIVLGSLLLLTGLGTALWNAGYLSRGDSTTIIEATPPDNPPQVVNITTDSQPPDIHVTTPPAEPDIHVVTTPPPAEPGPAPEIVSISGKVLDDTGREWQYGYEMKLRNLSSVDKTVSLKVSFLDENGFVVDDALTEKYVIPANSEKSFAGADMVPASKAANIRTVKGEFR